jgi:hypothetical protein
MSTASFIFPFCPKSGPAVRKERERARRRRRPESSPLKVRRTSRFTPAAVRAGWGRDGGSGFAAGGSAASGASAASNFLRRRHTFLGGLREKRGGASTVLELRASTQRLSPFYHRGRTRSTAKTDGSVSVQRVQAPQTPATCLTEGGGDGNVLVWPVAPSSARAPAVISRQVPGCSRS